MQRRVRALSLAAIAVGALLLSGCSVVNDIGRTGGAMVNEAAMSAGLAAAEQKLEEIDGVTAESQFAMTDAYVYLVGLRADIDEPTPDAVAAILEIARDTLAADPFAEHEAGFQLTSGERFVASLDYFGISAQQLAAEAAYYSSLESAFGHPLTVGISSMDEIDYHRYITGSDQVTVTTLESMRAIEEPSLGTGSFDFPGISAGGALPTDEVIELVHSLGEVATLQGARPDDYTGVQVTWVQGYNAVDVGISLDTFGDDVSFADSDGWPTVLAVADVMTASPVPVVFFSFSVYNENRYGTVTVSPCAEPGVPTPPDEEFLAALAGRLPTASAGFCAV